jgi:hypothetical protein
MENKDPNTAVMEIGNDSSSLVHYTEGALQKAILELPETVHSLSEKALETAIIPTELDYLLRSSFSREVARVRINGGCLRARDIYGDYCSKAFFYSKYLKSEKRLAWMIRPMPKYEKFMEAMLYVANKRLWELINVPLKHHGTYNPKMCAVVLSAYKMIKESVRGAPLQRSETKSLTVNVDTTAQAKVHDMSMDQLNREIRRLERVVKESDGPSEEKTKLSDSSNVEDTTFDLPRWSDQVES